MTKFERKYPPVSVHPTLHGQLQVNWEQEYQGEYICPSCNGRQLTFYRREKSLCKIRFYCRYCKKHTSLTQRISGNKQRLPISVHPTLHGQLEVNWKQEYNDEYYCPHCEKSKIKGFYFVEFAICQIELRCNFCQKRTYLTCQLTAHIYNYLPEQECPNPLCNKLGHDGQKGWIYKKEGKKGNCQCYFCHIVFNPNSTRPNSWVGIQRKDELLSFNFDNDTWNLRHFYKKPVQKSLDFQGLNPQWYRFEIKKYLHYLLKSVWFSSDAVIRGKLVTFRQFGRIIYQQNLENKFDINRKTVIRFLDSCQNNKSRTINGKLASLRDFFEWSNLEVSYLVRSRDFLKVSKNDADWLDEVTRQAIKNYLNKIPAPIARHYLVQEYIAARPGDVCQIAFDCLVEENGKWYVKFFQHKTKRWHKILASRKIRKVIEEQQQWIKDIFSEDNSFLFCHFRNINSASYPSFPHIKPLPEPPKTDTQKNPMVRIIRMLIEKENIRDANGQKPHFTGKILRSSRLQEVRTKYGIEAARLYADHRESRTTLEHYAPPTREQVAEVDLPFQKLLMNPDNKFLPWQSLPESLLKNPLAHELDLEIAPRLVVYGHCALDPKTPCPVNLFPKCYGCSSFRPSTGKLPLYERQYQGEQQRLAEAEKVGAELAQEEAKATIEAMDKWLPELRRLANG